MYNLLNIFYPFVQLSAHALSSAILCSIRSDWLNPVQELFTETGLSSLVKTVQYCDMRHWDSAR